VSKRIREHIRSNLVGYLALFVALSGTAYAATIGPNDIQDNAIRSRHIEDGQVRTQDVAKDTTTHALTGANVANGGLTGADVANGSLSGSQVADGSLAGADVQNNSLTGTQINESSLGQVPLAQVGGFGRATYGGSCYPSGAAFVDCVVLTVNLPTQSKVLLIGATEAAPQNGDAAGACKLVTQFGDIPNTVADYSLHGGDLVSGSLVGITGPLGPGSVDFGVDCNKTGGTMEYFAHLAAIQISPG
jgi:hypothetical protein